MVRFFLLNLVATFSRPLSLVRTKYLTILSGWYRLQLWQGKKRYRWQDLTRYASKSGSVWKHLSFSNLLASLVRKLPLMRSPNFHFETASTFLWWVTLEWHQLEGQNMRSKHQIKPKLVSLGSGNNQMVQNPKDFVEVRAYIYERPKIQKILQKLGLIFINGLLVDIGAILGLLRFHLFHPRWCPWNDMRAD